MPSRFETSRYSFELPEELIAQKPLTERSASRMMLINRETGEISHHNFREFPGLIPEDSMVVINNTKVLPVRLAFTRDTGGKGEVLLLKPLEEGVWEAMCRPASRMAPGNSYTCGDCLDIEILQDCGKGFKQVKVSTTLPSLEEALMRVGEVPLPPYIKRDIREEEDISRYQTVFAEITGSAAAPTAGFHFTPDVLSDLNVRGIPVEKITLHVGAGTFLPVRTADIREHDMHHEWFSVQEDVLEKALDPASRTIAVGTTSVRALEAASQSGTRADGSVSGETDLFIYPGFEFKCVNGILTNFHLPESTLLMLVCGFAGTDLTLKAYREAVKERYRFYSYGDCMLIL